MIDSAVVLLSAVGALTSFVFWLTGAYPWLRWGFTGVKAIWSKRRVIDEIVERDLELALDTSRSSSMIERGGQ